MPFLTTALSLGRMSLEAFSEVIAPIRCAACELRVRPRTLFCSTCAVSVALAAPSPSATEHAVFAYGGAVADAIVRFKYGGRSDLAARLGGAMAGAAESLHGIDVVVSVPVHPIRLAERGFDQAALLAKPIAQRLLARWEPRALVRLRDTPKQASLRQAARAHNVAAAFACLRPEKVANRSVLLVDDVRTTGSTLGACTSALRAAGVSAVSTLVLARRDREED
jgi:ComF family protein